MAGSRSPTRSSARSSGRPWRRSRGRPTSISSPGNSPKNIAPTIGGVIDGGQVLDVVEQHVTPKGEKLYVQTMKTPLFGPDGEAIGIQGIFWDVTERMRGGEAQGAERHAPGACPLGASGPRGTQGRPEPDGGDREASQPGTARGRGGPRDQQPTGVREQ